MNDREKLKALETHVAKQVCSVHGYLAAGEADELLRLRQRVGEGYDAINCRWVPLDAELS